MARPFLASHFKWFLLNILLISQLVSPLLLASCLLLGLRSSQNVLGMIMRSVYPHGFNLNPPLQSLFEWPCKVTCRRGTLERVSCHLFSELPSPCTAKSVPCHFHLFPLLQLQQWIIGFSFNTPPQAWPEIENIWSSLKLRANDCQHIETIALLA